MLLKDKCCVITGAAGGIGLQIATMFAREGASLALLDIQEDKIETVAAELGGRAYACDLRSVPSIEKAFAAVLNDMHRIDVLVNCAGLANRTPIEDIVEEEWDLLCDVNLKGLFFASREAYRAMLQQDGGKIINISSTRGYRSDGRHVIYDSTKAAVQALTRTFSVAGGAKGIVTNSISPGYVLTPMTKHNLDRKGWLESILVHIPINRLIEMEEVANAALYLASELSSGINGHDLVVDGGWTASE